jgi:prophage regulatory protein
MAPSQPQATRLIRLPEVIARTGLSRSTVLRYESEGLFPAKIKIGKRAVAWDAAAVEAHIHSRAIA